ncbi:hypothetical protein A2U01_0069558 [Trifolium medium]|uniref:Uncharacterized protein n=1 Tax=Trifolium medium TaxID=97028 RepID=A0A392SK28_9FABA|nr:hypothetical protein [Trifolium medium]
MLHNAVDDMIQGEVASQYFVLWLVDKAVDAELNGEGNSPSDDNSCAIPET